MDEKEQDVVEVVLSKASPMSVEDAAALSPDQRALVLRAAAKIEEADRIAAEKAEKEAREKELHEQSLSGRKERQAAANPDQFEKNEERRAEKWSGVK